MTDHETDDYAEWLKQRRSMPPNDDLTDRIMSALGELTPSSLERSVEAQSARGRDRIGPLLLLTAAALFFAIRIAWLVGNLAFPTESFPEFAKDDYAQKKGSDPYPQ